MGYSCTELDTTEWLTHNTWKACVFREFSGTRLSPATVLHTWRWQHPSWPSLCPWMRSLTMAMLPWDACGLLPSPVHLSALESLGCQEYSLIGSLRFHSTQSPRLAGDQSLSTWRFLEDVCYFSNKRSKMPLLCLLSCACLISYAVLSTLGRSVVSDFFRHHGL